MNERVVETQFRKDETIGSQTAALRAHAEQQGLDVCEEWIFEDEGHRCHPHPPGPGTAARCRRRDRGGRGAVLLP